MQRLDPALSLHNWRTTVRTKEQHPLQEMSQPRGPFSPNAMPGMPAALAGAIKFAKGFVDEGSANSHHHVGGRKMLVPMGLRQLSGIRQQMPAWPACCQVVHQPKGQIPERQKFSPSVCCGTQTGQFSCDWPGTPNPLLTSGSTANGRGVPKRPTMQQGSCQCTHPMQSRKLHHGCPYGQAPQGLHYSGTSCPLDRSHPTGGVWA